MSVEKINRRAVAIGDGCVSVKKDKVGRAMTVADGLGIAVAFKKAQLAKLHVGSAEHDAKKTSITILEEELAALTEQIRTLTR